MPPTHEAQATLLDQGDLPIEQLALLAEREGRRTRATYQVHRWFARRFASQFRGILPAAATPDGADFWKAYYVGGTWGGRSVLDPFMGGGTSVVEAHRLGATVYGVDADNVAVRIVDLECTLPTLPDLLPYLRRLQETVGVRLSPYYTTHAPDGSARVVLHAFHVQVVACKGCGVDVEAHPTWELAHDSTAGRMWLFCGSCHSVHDVPIGSGGGPCAACGAVLSGSAPPVRGGVLHCPHCNEAEPLIDVGARTRGPPRWRLFATESIPGNHVGSRSVPMRERMFLAATEADRRRLVDAAEALAEHGTWTATAPIAARPGADNRLTRYGYRTYSDLFGPRQRLHLAHLAKAISEITDTAVRKALTMAFSHHLATNCMMTAFAFGWRRLAPLFAVRGYRHVPRPVELNPWLVGTGRGTFPNAVRAIVTARSQALGPRELNVAGGFRHVVDSAGGPMPSIRAGDSRSLSHVEANTIDLVLTDPPYFDNIAYSDLADFYRPWLDLLDPSPDFSSATIAERGRGPVASLKFATNLGAVLTEVKRVLKTSGRLVFTYQHTSPRGWAALYEALRSGGFKAVQVFPMLGDINLGLHRSPGRSTWDAVLVFKPATMTPAPLTEGAAARARIHAESWCRRVQVQAAAEFREADRVNLRRACVVAAALGGWPSAGKDVSIEVALAE